MQSPNKSGLAVQIEKEIQQYLTGVVSIAQDYDYSQNKLVQRIAMFENKVYPTGKFDSQGNYKFWFSIQDSRIWDEVKNIDFDTRNILIYDERKIGELPAVIANLSLKQWLKDTGQAEEINDAIEEGAGWGNVVWKKVKGGYERVDLKNFYVINQTARTLHDSPEIERHELSQTELYDQGRAGGWEYLDEVADACKSDNHNPTIDGQKQESTIPYYEVYERNGEVSVADLKIWNNETPAKDDDKKFVLAKVIGSGVKGSGSGIEIKYVMFAQEISKLPYKEFHRGRYKGRWMREGLIELLFDLQVRANQIGNQIAQGLEWASKTIFTTPDKVVAQNVITDLNNGDIIKSSNGLKQVEVRMQGMDQLIADWNRVIQAANDIANSTEVVQGDDLGSGVPFRLGALLNQNSNKLFDFIREKLAIPFSEMMEEWIVPELISDLKLKDVIRLVGDSDLMDRLVSLLVDDWYLSNLVAIGPHTQDIADNLKAEKADELRKRPQLLMNSMKIMFTNFKAHVSVDITGEALNLDADLQTLGTFAQLEQDPVRRQAIIELMARKKGLDFGALPKMPPENTSTIQGAPQVAGAGNGSKPPMKAPPAPVSTAQGK